MWIKIERKQTKDLWVNDKEVIDALLINTSLDSSGTKETTYSVNGSQMKPGERWKAEEQSQKLIKLRA